MEDKIHFYFLLSLSLLVVALKFHLSRKQRKNLPPSPPSLPILGHLHLIKQPAHRIFHALSQEHGPVISLRFGSQLVVVVSSPTVVEECFTKNDIVLANRPKLLVGKRLGYNYTTLTQSSYGDHWHNLRRIGAVEIFSTHRINMFSSIQKDEIKRLLIKLSRGDRNSLHGFNKVELKSIFQELTFNVMMRMISGKRYYGDEVSDVEEARQFREIMKETTAYGGASNPADFLPILNWIDGGNFEKRLKILAKRFDKFVQGLIDEQRRKEGSNSIIDHLLCNTPGVLLSFCP